MHRLFLFLKLFDWVLLLPVFLLSIIGLSAIYSIDISRNDTLIFFPTQSIALGLGMMTVMIATLIHKTRYESLAKIGYIIGLVLLVSVLFFGVTIRGTTGWFRLAGFSFQPAEVAKISLILLLAWLIQKQGRRFEKMEFVVSSIFAVGFYAGLILLQPDLGSTLVLGGIWFGLLLAAGIPKKYIITFISIALFVASCAWLFLFQDYQKERVLTFLHPERDPLGSGYNVNQSLIAIGSGQLFGRGLGFGSQSQLHFLPEAQTDFIIAVIGEELGFVGLCVVLLLFYLLLWRLLWLSQRVKDDFSSYTLIGIACLFFIQLSVNIGGATGLLPVTGVTLPFVSYGGSSILINYALIGIAGSIAQSNARFRLS